MKIKRLFQFTTLSALVIMMSACSDNGDDVTGPGTSDPTLEAIWSGDDGIGTFLEQNCASCHSTSSAFGGFIVSSYAEIMSGDQIMAGDADNSLFIQKLEGTAPGGQMPPAGPLDQEDIDVIRQWITDGAQDN